MSGFEIIDDRFQLSLNDPGPQPSPQSFLFNDKNLAEYATSMRQGIHLIMRTLKARQRPFTGTLPHELARAFAEIELDIPLPSIESALEEVEALYLKDAVYFHHPKYVAHLNCPVAYPALLAELILTAINTSVDTWDQSAGATLIEQKLIDWTCAQLHLGAQADGIFTSGGTQSNLMALLLARDYYCLTHLQGHCVKQQGLPHCHSRFRIFTSACSHFSVQKSAALLGLGYQAVVPVACDETFRMDSQALRQAIETHIEQGLIPIAVVATAGTTDFGSLDPLHAIADLCESHQIWMHTDAAYGCGLLASRQRRHLLEGIERSDSVTVDYHKSFLQPVSCSAFFARQKQHLGCVTHHADYLNPLSAQQEGTPNLVNKSLQTTRRFDALKLWLTLRTAGLESIGDIFDQVCELARMAHQRFAEETCIELAHVPELSTLVFRFAPMTNGFKGLKITNALLDEVNQTIRKQLFRSGHAVIAGTKVYNHHYLKFTLLNPATSLEDIDEILQLIKSYGYDFLHKRAINTDTLNTLDN